MRRQHATIIAVLISFPLLAADTTDVRSKLAKLESTVRQIGAKAGISLDGEFRSELAVSGLSGPSLAENRRSTESNEYTSVDFDIKARPLSAVGARLVFRMHQNWQNFFSDISNPIFTRWISIDGNLKDVFHYSAGDFRLKYSPLMLYSPDVDMLYEPEIFAKLRTRAMDERFLGDNNRVLQGLNLAFDAEVYPLLNELHLNALGIRLRSIETSIKNGSMPVSVMERSDIEKYACGGNLDATFLKGVSLGGTFLDIFDTPASLRGSDTVSDTLAQNTRVVGIRPGVDIDRLLGLEKWTFGLSADVGISVDDTAWWVTEVDSSLTLLDSTLQGLALRAGGDVGYDNGRFNVALSCNYINNGALYRNELAQSPSFVGTRIMNTENDTAGPYDVTSYHYSSFDALYGNVFKFAPSAATNLWDKAPFQKNAYTNTIFTQSELRTLRGKMDPALQLVMPFGPATPNRSGIDAKLSAGIAGLEVQGLLRALNEVEVTRDLAHVDSVTDTIAEFPKTQFTQIGGGLSFDVKSVWKRLPYPLRLSGSFVRSQAVNAGPDAFAGNDWSITSDFLNAGLYWKFWRRAALLGGLQTVLTDAQRGTTESSRTQWHYGGGLEWAISEGAFVVGSISAIGVQNAAKEDGEDVTGAEDADFTQVQPGVLLKVTF